MTIAMLTALLVSLSLLQAEPLPPPEAKPAAPSAAPASSQPDPAKAEEAKPASPAVEGAPAAVDQADAQEPPAASAALPAADGDPVAAPAPLPPPPAPPAEAAPPVAAPEGAPVPIAAVPASTTPAACPAVEPERPANDYATVGVGFGLGFPDFGMASVVVRPMRWFRVSAGGTYNYAGYGLRGEATLAPIRWYLSPTLNVAYGRYLKMDATRGGKMPSEVSGLASRIGYQYLSTTLGIELGNPHHGMLVIQVGAAHLWLDAPGTATFDASAGGSGGTSTTTVELSGLSASGWVPAASLGWIIFL